MWGLEISLFLGPSNLKMDNTWHHWMRPHGLGDIIMSPYHFDVTLTIFEGAKKENPREFTS